MSPRPRHAAIAVLGALGLSGLLAACGSSAGTSTSTATSAGPVTVRLLTHESFALSEGLLADFAARTGITVEVLAVGDAGTLVNSAVLASGNPEADVLFGIDTTFLSRALEADVFEPYVSTEASSLRPELADLAAGPGRGMVTPVDDGDVCVNIDDAWFAERDMTAPRTLRELTDPAYRDLLVVQNPASSSPGLAFLLATIDAFGDGWQDYWRDLRANGVLVVDGWTEAYVGAFTGGEGDRPLVVSYSTSPPAEIVYAAEPKPSAPSTSVMLDGCYRQVEFAGVLRGAAQPDAARAVVDWMLSPEVQADVPLSMFVFPARADVVLPEVFTDFVVRPQTPSELDPALIEANRAAWIEQWSQIAQ